MYYETKYTLKFFHLLELWTRESNIRFREDIVWDLKQEVKKVNPPIVTPGQLFRGMSLPSSCANPLIKYGKLYQPALTSFSCNINVANHFAYKSPDALNLVVQYVPQPKDIVLDLVSLPKDPQFITAFEYFKPGIPDCGDSISYYLLDSVQPCREEEYVIDTQQIPFVNIESIGGNINVTLTSSPLSVGLFPSGYKL